MNHATDLEDQLREAVDSLDARLPHGLAERIVRQATRRRHRRRALVGCAGVAGVALVSTVVVTTGADQGNRPSVVGTADGSAATRYLGGVGFTLPEGYQGQLFPGSTQMLSGGGFQLLNEFHRGDEVLRVAVVRGNAAQEVSASATPHRMLGKTTAIFAEGPPGDARIVLDSARDVGMNTTASTDLDGFHVPVPDGFRVVRRSGPDVPIHQPAQGLLSRSTVLLAPESVTDAHVGDRGTISVVITRWTRLDDSVTGGVDRGVASTSVTRRLDATALLQVTGYGTDEVALQGLTSAVTPAHS